MRGWPWAGLDLEDLEAGGGGGALGGRGGGGGSWRGDDRGDELLLLLQTPGEEVERRGKPWGSKENKISGTE